MEKIVPSSAVSEARTKPRMPLRRICCARCGSEFDCGGGKDGGCWCMEEAIRLPMPTTDGVDCLCPACMRAEIRRQR